MSIFRNFFTLPLKKAARYIYVICLSGLQKSASKAVSRKAAALLLPLGNEIAGPVMFFPYGSPDCLALHTGLCRRLNLTNVPANIEDLPPFELNQYLRGERTPGNFSDFQSRLREGLVKAGLDAMYYPLLDSFIRSIPHHLFFSEIQISESLYADLIEHVHLLRNISAKYKACFLADSAYLNNGIIKQLFLGCNKPVFYLNPNGKIQKYNNISHAEFSAHGSLADSYIKNKIAVDAYLELRFSGGSRSDLDSSRAYAEFENDCFDPNKKVLFLHAFRDANNITWRSEQPFDSYFEWVDYTFRIIHEANEFERWYIKAHPSSDFYENDSEILEKLMHKYNVPKSCIRSPSTPYIIKKKMHVYTNSGTIVLETAANGFSAFFCGARFEQKYGNFAANREVWKNGLLLDKSHSKKLDKSTVASARYQLYYDFAYKNIAALCPSRAVLPRETRSTIIWLLSSQIYNSFFLDLEIDMIPRIKTANHDSFF